MRASTPNLPKIYLALIAVVCLALSALSLVSIRHTTRSNRLLDARADPLNRNLNVAETRDLLTFSTPSVSLPSIVSIRYGDPHVARLYNGMLRRNWIINLADVDPRRRYLMRFRVIHEESRAEFGMRDFEQRNPIAPKFTLRTIMGPYPNIQLPLGVYVAELTLREPRTETEIRKTVEIFVDHSDEEYSGRVGFHLRSQGLGLHENGSSTIEVSCVDRAVTLRGWVATRNDRRRASNVAALSPTSRTLGVETVTNLLSVHAELLEAAFGI